MLIADGATSSTFYLKGAPGYNNAVKLLDDLCYTCYSNSSIGGVGKSFNFDYIEAQLKTKPTYTKRTSAQSVSYSYYPVVYQEEWYSQIGDINTYIPPGDDYAVNQRALSNSQQKVYYKTTSGSTGKGYSQSSSGITPTNTYLTQSYKGATNRALFKNEKNAYMITGKGDGETGLSQYWLASRCVNLNSSYCNFRVRCVNSGSVNATNMFYSYSNTNNSSYAVRPVVEFTLSSVVLGESGSNAEGIGWSIRKS